VPGIVPLLQALGTNPDRLLTMAPDEDMEVTLAARPDVLARLSPELAPLNRLSAMFQVGGSALLDLDNYENGSVRVAAPADEVLDEAG